MMRNYYIETEIKELSERIKVLSEKDSNNFFDEKIKKSELDWNLTNLLTEILYQSEEVRHFSKKELENFHKEYEYNNNITIDLQDLLDKQWIRIIDNQIILPNVITSNFSYFREYGKDKEKPKFIIEQLGVFEFIFALHQKIGYRDENRLTIKKSILIKTIKNHRNLFETCPNYEYFKKNGFFKEITDEKIEINLRTCNLYNEISNKIASILWKKILLDNKNDYLISLSVWQNKIRQIAFNLPDLSKLLPNKLLNKLLETAIEKILSEKDLDYSSKEIDKLWWDRQFHNNFHYNIIETPSKHKIDTTNYLNLYLSLTSIEHSNHIVSNQEIRSDFSFLLNLVITNDYTRNFQNSYNYTKRLLKSSLNKPFVFWEILHLIKEKRPEILPYLLIEKEFSAIAQISIRNFKVNPKIFYNQERTEISIKQEELFSEFWQKGFVIFLEQCSHIIDKNEIAKNINFVFVNLLKEIFQSPNNTDLKVNLTGAI